VNLREGTRRLALLLGVVGAILGGFASYVDLQTTLAQRTRHSRFEQLANSGVVQHERKCRLAGITSGCSDLPNDFVLKPTQGSASTQYLDPQTGEPIQGWEEPSQVNKGGIKAIRWGKDYGVETIETDDGQTLYPTPAPAAWGYLLVSLFPILGFIIPWGAVRAIGWVIAGFVQPPS
jgi:hypothetical protein